LTGIQAQVLICDISGSAGLKTAQPTTALALRKRIEVKGAYDFIY